MQGHSITLPQKREVLRQVERSPEIRLVLGEGNQEEVQEDCDKGLG